MLIIGKNLWNSYAKAKSPEAFPYRFYNYQYIVIDIDVFIFQETESHNPRNFLL